MNVIEFGEISLAFCRGLDDVTRSISKILEKRISFFPEDKDALILLKPNFNNDLNALFGATTDLRVIVAVISFLKSIGYKNIVIGDGPNVGYFHARINVIKRLAIDRLAEKFGVETIDFNFAPTREVRLDNQNRVRIPAVVLDRDFFINLPKIKTHNEAQLTMCLKNLVGCLAGFDKRKVHDDIPGNILKLYRIIKPDIQIIDGLIGMEGYGPSRGVMKELGLIIVGVDPLLTDSFCAKLVGFDYREVPYLKLAEERGLIDPLHYQILDELKIKFQLQRPEKNILADIFLKNFFVMARYKWLDFLFSSKIVSKILFALKLRQEEIISEDDSIEKIYIDKRLCDDCRICSNYCPLSNSISSNFVFSPNNCICCFYCFFVCPKKAIKIEGKLHYFSQLVKIYEKTRHQINNQGVVG